MDFPELKSIDYNFFSQTDVGTLLTKSRASKYQIAQISKITSSALPTEPRCSLIVTTGYKLIPCKLVMASVRGIASI